MYYKMRNVRKISCTSVEVYLLSFWQARNNGSIFMGNFQIVLENKNYSANFDTTSIALIVGRICDDTTTHT